MKSLSWRTYMVFVITGVFIGVLVSVQVKSAMPTSSFIYDELAVQKELIKEFIDDQALLKSKIVSIRSQIEENQQKNRQISEQNNLETLKTLKSAIGLETAKGDGVSIKINDGIFVTRENIDTVDESLVAASDLRDIVNLLRTTKPEAIAINDQRIIASTPITSVGNTVLVNNYNLLPPFVISAIGDNDLILQRMKDSTTLTDIKKRAAAMKIQFEYTTRNNLIIPVYNGNLLVKYLQNSVATPQ